ncbi:hypothetical protein Tco_0411456, partial [Tanacetum coccineum]
VEAVSNYLSDVMRVNKLLWKRFMLTLMPTEAKTANGACYLELKVPSRSRRDDGWDFRDRYGYHYGDVIASPLRPSEADIEEAKTAENAKLQSALKELEIE